MGSFATKSQDDGVPFTMTFDNSGGSDGKQTIYVGEADPGTLKASARWRIKKFTLDVNDNPTDIQWATGNRNFDKVWNSRTTYTYS